MITYDFSEELLLQPYLKGIKLVKPKQGLNIGRRLGDVCRLDMNIYFTDADKLMRHFNDEQAHTFEFSKAELLNKSLYECLDQKSAEKLEINNKKVMNEQCVNLLDEEAKTINRNNLNVLSIKMPWYNNNKVIGVFGLSIVLEKHKLAQGLLKIAELGFMNCDSLPVPGKHIFEQYLSKRESDVLPYTLKGYGAKQIARVLKISPRTVEMHLENIKEKLNVKSRVELIDLFNS